MILILTCPECGMEYDFGTPLMCCIECLCDLEGVEMAEPAKEDHIGELPHT